MKTAGLIKIGLLFLILVINIFAFEWTPDNQIPNGYSVIRFERNLKDAEDPGYVEGAYEYQAKTWDYKAQFEIIGKFVPTRLGQYEGDTIFGRFNLTDATVRWEVENDYTDTLKVFKQGDRFKYTDQVKKTCIGNQHTSSKGEEKLSDLKYYYTAGSLADTYGGDLSLTTPKEQEEYFNSLYEGSGLVVVNNTIKAESDKHGFLKLELRKPNFKYDKGNFYEFLPTYHDGNFLVPVLFSQTLTGIDGEGNVMEDPGCSFTSINLPDSVRPSFLQYQIPVVEYFEGTKPTELKGSKKYYNMGFQPYNDDNFDFSETTKPIEINIHQILSPGEDEPSWTFSWEIKLNWDDITYSCQKNGASCSSDKDCCSYNCYEDQECLYATEGGECPGVCADASCLNIGDSCSSGNNCCPGLSCNEYGLCDIGKTPTGGDDSCDPSTKTYCAYDGDCCSGYTCDTSAQQCVPSDGGSSGGSNSGGGGTSPIPKGDETCDPSTKIYCSSQTDCCGGYVCDASQNSCECDPDAYLSAFVPDGKIQSGSELIMPPSNCNYEVVVTPSCQEGTACEDRTYSPPEGPSTGKPNNRILIGWEGTYTVSLKDAGTGQKVGQKTFTVIDLDKKERPGLILGQDPVNWLIVIVIIIVLILLYLRSRKNKQKEVVKPPEKT